MTERKSHQRTKSKGPKATISSLQRWLKGAYPAVRAYSKNVSNFAVRYDFKSDRARNAAAETASILKNMEAMVTRLRDTVDDALSEF